MSLFFTAIGLVLFIEGLVYAGFPALVKKMASQIHACRFKFGESKCIDIFFQRHAVLQAK